MDLKLNLDDSTSNYFNNNYNEDELNRYMFDFIYVIGKGGFGKVWKVQYKKTKEYFALKEMSKRKIIDKKSEKSINSERKFLSYLNHPFMVNMHYAFQDNDNLYLVMDMLSGGDLRYHCSRYRIFSEEQTRFFIACIIFSLEYIHSNNVIHRDIKPENLVLDEKGYVRITDFGIAKENKLDNSSETSGTPGYMSPEVMNGKNHSFQADFFAIGVIGYEFLMGNRPFNGKNRKEIKEKMFGEKVMIHSYEVKKGWSLEGADFINQLLERKQKKRLGAKGGVKELKEHQWLKYYPWGELEQKKLPAPFVPEPIDNFDKSYCESIEKITEETKVRYKKIYESSKYKDAFVDFYYNKDEPKYQRKSVKSQKVPINNNKIIDTEEDNTNDNNNNNNNDNDLEEEKKSNLDDESKSITKENYFSFGSSNTEKGIGIANNNKSSNINDNSNHMNVDISDEKIQKVSDENIKNDNKEKSFEEEKEKFFSDQKVNNLKKDININFDNKKFGEIKLINYSNSKDIPKINKFKKISVNNINNTSHMKKTNEDYFLKDYIKYHNEKKKKNKEKNYYRDNSNILYSNFNTNKKCSSLLSFSPKLNMNNITKKMEYSGSQKMIENCKVKPFFYNIMNNNSKSNFLLKHNDNKIKYQKIKKKNNSFRINYYKNISKDSKSNLYNIPSLNNQYENKSNINIHTNNLEQKFMHKKIIGFNFKDDKRKLKKYDNNSAISNNNNNTDNYSLNISNNIHVKKLFNHNNQKVKNNPKIYTNFIPKENGFNFKGKITKYKLSGNNNNMLYSNYLSNVVGFHFNLKKKKIEKTFCAHDYKHVGNKTMKLDKGNLNTYKSNKKYNSCSYKKKKVPFYVSS